jgi:O-antigen/teichoic acid export membrane protein
MTAPAAETAPETSGSAPSQSDAGGASTSHAPGLGRQVVALSIGRMLAFAVTFVAPLVLVRLFSQAEYGLYKQLLLVHETLVSVLALGLAASLFYFVPHFPDQRRAYVSNVVFALAAAAAVGLGTVVAFKAQIAWLLNNPALEASLPLLAVFTGFCLVTSALESLMIITKHARLAAVTVFVSEGLRAGLVLAAALWTHDVQGIVIALVAWGGCRVVTLVVYLRTLGIRTWARPRWAELGPLLQYSIPFGLAVVVRTCSESLHQYMVAHAYGPTLFAVYSVGYLQIPVVAIAFESTSEVALVRLAELRRDGLLDRGAELIRHAVSSLSIILLPLYAWLMLNARDVIGLLYTDRFEASVPIFRVFLATIPLTALALDYVPRAFADTGFILRVNLFRLAVNVVLLLVLWPIGVLGAALATVGAMAVAKLVVLRRARTLCGVPARRLMPWARLGAATTVSALAALVAWLAQSAVASGRVAGLAVSALSFGLCYVSVAWVGGLIEPADKQRLQGALAGVARATWGRG